MLIAATSSAARAIPCLGICLDATDYDSPTTMKVGEKEVRQVPQNLGEIVPSGGAAVFQELLAAPFTIWSITKLG